MITAKKRMARTIAIAFAILEANCGSRESCVSGDGRDGDGRLVEEVI